MIRIFISFNPQSEQVSGIISNHNNFLGYIEETPNNYYRSYIDFIKEKKSILKSLQNGNKLVIEYNYLSWNSMMGEFARYGHPDAGEEIFTCKFEAFGEDYRSTLRNLDEKIQRDCRVKSPKVYLKTPASYKLTLQK